MTNTG